MLSQILNSNYDFKKMYEGLSKHGGVCIFNNENEDDIKYLEDILHDYDDLESFRIYDRNNTGIVIRYLNNNPKISYDVVLNEGNFAYDQKNYYQCIKKYMLLLSVAKCPNDYMYGKIGLCYDKLGDKERAEVFLMIANQKSGRNKDFNYNESIEYFEKKISNIDNERRLNRIEQEERTSFDRYEFKNFDKFVGYLSENKKDIETAGIEFNLSNEEKDFVKLVFAREYFKQGNIEKGNYYLNAVENSPNKSKKIIKFCDEIRKNKLFYQYRDNNDNVRKLAFVKTGKRKRI